MTFEVRGDQALIASCSDRAVALLLAREWLRESTQRDADTRTCVVQIRDRQNRLVGEHVVALSKRLGS